MKPRIRRHFSRHFPDLMRWECKLGNAYGYGRTMREAFEMWLDDPIPF